MRPLFAFYCATILPPTVYDSHFPPARRIAARCRLSRFVRLGIRVASSPRNSVPWYGAHLLAMTLPPSVRLTVSSSTAHCRSMSPDQNVIVRRGRFKASKQKTAATAATCYDNTSLRAGVSQNSVHAAINSPRPWRY